MDVAAFKQDDAPAHAFKLRERALANGENLVVHGHVLIGPDGEEGVVPTAVRARYVARDGARLFASTAVPCAMGMCGGPVVDENGDCVGMLEGIVPDDIIKGHSDAMTTTIAGAAAIIGAQELQLFLGDVERNIEEMR